MSWVLRWVYLHFFGKVGRIRRAPESLKQSYSPRQLTHFNSGLAFYGFIVTDAGKFDNKEVD